MFALKILEIFVHKKFLVSTLKLYISPGMKKNSQKEKNCTAISITSKKNKNTFIAKYSPFQIHVLHVKQ